MIDILTFSIGVAAGGLAALPWLWPVLAKYVLLSRCPSPAHCPHHREAWKRVITQTNDNTRKGPTRPPLR